MRAQTFFVAAALLALAGFTVFLVQNGGLFAAAPHDPLGVNGTDAVDDGETDDDGEGGGGVPGATGGWSARAAWRNTDGQAASGTSPSDGAGRSAPGGRGALGPGGGRWSDAENALLAQLVAQLGERARALAAGPTAAGAELRPSAVAARAASDAPRDGAPGARRGRRGRGDRGGSGSDGPRGRRAEQLAAVTAENLRRTLTPEEEAQGVATPDWAYARESFVPNGGQPALFVAERPEDARAERVVMDVAVLPRPATDDDGLFPNFYGTFTDENGAPVTLATDDRGRILAWYINDDEGEEYWTGSDATGGTVPLHEALLPFAVSAYGPAESETLADFDGRDLQDDPEALTPDVAPADEAAPGGGGLRADYYDFLDGQLRTIPDLAALPPTLSRRDPNIDFPSDSSFALPFEPETFAALWRGVLHVPADGDYEFTCGSDDGVRLTLDGAVVLEHAGLRAYGETAGRATLAAGPHDFALVFYENYVYASCRLFWRRPGETRREIIGPEYFSPPADVAAAVPPRLSSLAPARGMVGDRVVLRGAGFSPEPLFNRVTFAGTRAEILSASETRLEVEVPVGALTGDVVVQVGPLATRGLPFELTNLVGLFAEYYRLEQDLDTMPDFHALTPYFVRVDGPLDFADDSHWALPYDPDIFAARYSGYLYAPSDDDYTITLGADDGARLLLDGAEYLALPGLHPYQEGSRTNRLAQGFHPLEIEFFENRGVARLRLFWQRRGEQTRSVIGRGYLFAPEELATQAAPVLERLEPAAAPLGAEIELFGSGFGVNAGMVRVLFGGEVWVRPLAAEETRLRVRVPLGASSGPLRIEVGIKKSAARPFTVASQQGLQGDFYLVGEATDDAAADGPPSRAATRALWNRVRGEGAAALAGQQPLVSRVDTDWQFPDGPSWNLPHWGGPGIVALPFIAHWHGTLGTEYGADRVWLLQSDDGALLFIDGQLVVDNGPWHALRENAGAARLAPGRHQIDLFYVNEAAPAALHFLWNPLGRPDHLPVPAHWFQPADLAPAAR